MNFQDSGIIIAKKHLKESYAIVNILSQSHGICGGIVRERDNKSQILHQVGSLVDFTWRARLEEHVGHLKCEFVKSYPNYFINNKVKLYAFNSIISLISVAFHEHDNNNHFFDPFKEYLDSLKQNFDFLKYIKIELNILSEAGYGLQLDKCAVTNQCDNLLYVSPKSGKAVSENAGKEFATKLLAMPNFLRIDAMNDSGIDIISKKQAFDLTTYFFNRYFINFSKKNQPREAFIKLCLD